MKIRITGPCGSGKSTLARKLAQAYGLQHYEMDNLIWDRSEPNKRFPQAERDARLRQVISSENWVLEGAQFKWGQESFKEAELIILLVPHVLVRDYRIIRRFIRCRTGIEPGNYKQTFAQLRVMLIQWNHGFKLDEVLRHTEDFGQKRLVAATDGAVWQEVEKLWGPPPFPEGR